MRAIGILLLATVGLLALVAFGARFHDGPVGLLPGGPLRAGPLQEDGVADWSFAADEDTIELQLLSQQRSRTTWILVRDGAAFVPCNVGFPPGKSWHHRAMQDGSAILRIREQRYPVSLDRVEDTALAQILTEMVPAKYSRRPPGDTETWFFRVTPRKPR
jgi:hypothetical protein